MATFEKAENIEYNADGNIVVYGENSYAYDGLGRLIRENNKALDKTFLFEYNVGGNIMYRSEFPYTTGAVGTVTKIYDHYHNNAWQDQLTSYDYQPITYDASGNPISYMGKTLTWSRGRLLTKYVISPLYSISMQHDANGIRCSKTKFAAGPTLVGAYTTTNYTYDSEGRLRCESDGIYTRYFIYGADGIVGYEENGVQFMYRKNLFGDITAIYNGTTKVAEYVYDAWGNCTVTTNVNGYGTRNPFRYRGYYWDNDLNLYYLLSRYYDPQTGIFINADTPDYLDPKTINGLNLYSYCNNNPIMNVDTTGHDWSSFMNFLATSADILITGAAIVGGAVIGLLAGGGVAGAVVVSVASTIVVNTLVNVVYYNCVSADPNNEIMLHEEAHSKLNRDDQKSYYVDNGYINRWDRLKFIKSKNQGNSFYSGGWHDYSEYSAHMYAWLFSGWAHNTNIPVVDDVASSSVYNDFGMNTPLIELWIHLLGFLGI